MATFRGLGQGSGLEHLARIGCVALLLATPTAWAGSDILYNETGRVLSAGSGQASVLSRPTSPQQLRVGYSLSDLELRSDARFLSGEFDARLGAKWALLRDPMMPGAMMVQLGGEKIPGQ